jgi:hypothetical protein
VEVTLPSGAHQGSRHERLIYPQDLLIAADNRSENGFIQMRTHHLLKINGVQPVIRVKRRYKLSSSLSQSGKESLDLTMLPIVLYEAKATVR